MATFTLFCSVSVDPIGDVIGETVNVDTVSKPGVGEYVVNLVDSSGPEELTTNVSIRGSTPGIVSWQPNASGTALEIFTFDAAGNPADRSFDVICFRIIS